MLKNGGAGRLFRKIFIPDRDIPLGEANALLLKEQ
jgi:hypothetical protein